MRSVRVLRCIQVRMASDTCDKLNATELLHAAVSLVIKDEGFALPTVPAKIARKKAETILEWSSDNKLAWKNFSEKKGVLMHENHSKQLGLQDDLIHK